MNSIIRLDHARRAAPARSAFFAWAFCQPRENHSSAAPSRALTIKEVVGDLERVPPQSRGAATTPRILSIPIRSGVCASQNFFRRGMLVRGSVSRSAAPSLASTATRQAFRPGCPLICEVARAGMRFLSVKWQSGEKTVRIGRLIPAERSVPRSLEHRAARVLRGPVFGISPRGAGRSRAGATS